MTEKYSPLWESWLAEASKGLRSHPDYSQVRRELLDHLEDRRESLCRAFPDLSREEAERLALEGMGEAKELSQALAKAHNWLLGSVYELSQLLLVMAVVLVSLEGAIMLWRWILPLAVPSWPF